MTNEHFYSWELLDAEGEWQAGYSWELLDAEGEWQAGGQANALDDVRREGARYLMQYSQDGPHKLVITEHITQTLEVVQ